MHVGETIRPSDRLGIDGQENAVAQIATVFGWWRRDLPLEVSYRYWRDVHSVMVARVPGLHQYRILNLDSNLQDVWPAIDGIDYTLLDSERTHGIAEFLFLTKDDQQTFGNSSLITQHVNQDEPNLVDRNVTMSAIGNNAHTYVDWTRGPTANGKPLSPSFVLCFQQRDVSSEQFRHHLVQLAHSWSQQPDVMRLRLNLLEPYKDKENSPCVSHDWPKEKRYQAWMELVGELAALKPILSSSEHARVIRAIHTFPVPECYTLVYGGKLTDVGLRGFPAVQTIVQAGAENQRQPDLLEAIYGSVVRR